MKKDERQAKIKDYVQQQGYVSFQQLKMRFPDYSEMTLRNDLQTLHERQQIVRIHGGATALPSDLRSDDLFFRHANRKVAQKQLIARKATQLIRPNDSIFIDNGTTATELAKVFPDESVSIVTTSISCAMELARLRKPSVYLLGGDVNRYNLGVHSPKNQAILEQMNFNLMFMAVAGYSKETGFTCGTEVEDIVRKTAMSRSAKVVALMDSGKVGTIFTVTYATPDDIDILISDGELDEETQNTLLSHGVQIL